MLNKSNIIDHNLSFISININNLFVIVTHAHTKFGGIYFNFYLHIVIRMVYFLKYDWTWRGIEPPRWLFSMDQPRFVRAPTLDKYKRQQKWHLFKLQIRIRNLFIKFKI